MKKITIIILSCLILSTNIFAEYKKGFSGYCEIGKDIMSEATYTDIMVRYKLVFFNIGFIPYAGQITWFYYNPKTNYNKGFPFRDIYYLGNIIELYENITFGIEHYCSHKVIYDDRCIERRKDEPPLLYSMTKAYIRYDF